MGAIDEKKRPAALDLETPRKDSSDSTSSTSSLGKPPRTPRFAEATSIHSPIEANGDRNMIPQSQPGDIGFGYINSNPESVTMPMSPRSPLKSAMRAPGTPGRGLNPLSPTFREEELLEKREAHTDGEQVKDLVCKYFHHDKKYRQPSTGTLLTCNDRKSKLECGWPSLRCVASTSAAV